MVVKPTASPLSVGLASSDFPGGLPPILQKFQMASDTGYVGRKLSGLKARKNRTMAEVSNAVDAYTAQRAKIDSGFSHLFTDYDRDEVLPTTCALGYVKPTHTELEERGKVGEDSNFVIPDEIMKILSDYYRPLVKHVDLSISMVRNKLIGWPHLVTGMDRETNNLFLSVHAALAIGARDANIPLSTVTQSLEARYGPCFFPYAERYQHTKKVMPMWIAGRAYFSQNVEPRCRMVVPSSKYMVIQNRVPVKKMLTALLASDIHVQDRATMKKRISSFLGNPRWNTISLDHSKFDQRHGMPRADKILKLISEVTGHPSSYPDFVHEFSMKNLVYYKDKAYFTGGTEILKSGVSPTTLVGCVGDVADCLYAIANALGCSYEEAWKQRGTTWDLMCWGDDAVLAYDKTIPFSSIERGFKIQKLAVEEEPTIKYLGNHYAKGKFSGSLDLGYPTGRGVQQLFFPERVKVYPFSTIGYVARLEILGERAKAFHDVTIKSFWDDKLYGPPFKFEDRFTVMSEAVKKAESYADKISSMDDILLSLTHGTLDLGVSKLDLEGLEEILGLVQVDVSDPLKLLAEEAPSHKAVSSILTDLLKGRIDAESKFQNYLSTNKGLNVRRGYPVY